MLKRSAYLQVIFQNVTWLTGPGIWPRHIETNKIRATTMSAEQEYFRVGDRVKLSDLGMQRMPRNRSTTAKVVGFGRSDTRIRIVFDGSRYPVSLHTSYLQRDDE
jgi:hypothetical protein